MSTVAARGTDRFNPILVKEVRASLRARAFRIVFQAILIGTVLVAILTLANVDPNEDSVGKLFFEPIYACLCIALLGVIPMSAFFSMAGEWDESAYDLLAISNLRPRHIVLGKLLTNAIEALLYFSAFAPILVLAFLLRGIDIGVVLVVLALTYVASIGSCAAAIGLSSMARARAARVLLLVLLAGMLCALIVYVLQMVVFELNRPFLFGTMVFGDFVITLLMLTCGAGALGLAVACERLAHPEENHSTGPRVILTGMYAVFLAWAALWQGASWYAGTAAIGLTLVTLAQVFFVTENETLTRRVQRQVPRSAGLALLATPFFPGGGRAILLFGVHVLMAVLFGLLAEAYRTGTVIGPPAWWFEHGFAFLVFAGYLFVYIAGISLPFSRRSSEVRVRWIARVAVPLVALLTIFGPSIVDFLVAKHHFVEIRHPLNPFMVLEPNTSDVTLNRICVVLVPLVVVVGLANLARLDHAWREVQKGEPRQPREGLGMSTLVARSTDRINPILLKEVRAALRGRWFRSTFAIVLSLAVIASIGFLMFTADSPDLPRGTMYFGTMTSCMGLGVHGLVPFAAMLSMTAESDEHTLELLQLSGLAGWRIVLGKLGSAMLQMLLIVSAFAPFLTVAFLMRGIALETVLYSLLGTAVTGLVECSVGLMLGSLTRRRGPRIFLLVVFAFFLLIFRSVGSLWLLFGVLRSGMSASSTVSSMWTAIGLLGSLVVASVCLAIAAARLGHFEENQSTPMRVTTSLVVLGGIAVAAFQPTTNDAATALEFTVLLASLLMLFLVTERESLPRAVAAHVPRWSRVFPLIAWLPGGGLGALYVIVHWVAILLAYAALCSLRFHTTPLLVGASDSVPLLGVILNSILFLLLPSAILSGLTKNVSGRVLVRVLVIVFFAAANLGPIMLSFLLERQEIANWPPVVAPFQFQRGPTFFPPWVLLIFLALVALIANVPRIVGSVRAVAKAARQSASKPVVHAASVA